MLQVSAAENVFTLWEFCMSHFTFKPLHVVLLTLHKLLQSILNEILCSVLCIAFRHYFLSFPSKGFLHESWISACFCNSIHQIVSRRMNVCVITLRRAMAYNLVIGFVNQPIVELRLILCNSDGFFRDFSTHVDGDQIFLTKVSNFRKCFWIENFIEVVDTAIHASKYSHEKVRLIKRVFVITLSQRVTTN